MKSIKTIFITSIVVLFAGCSATALVSTQNILPDVYQENNTTQNIQKKSTITLFRLNNYTDTPRAGMRASNILEGLFLAKGYRIISHIKEEHLSLDEAQAVAKKDGSIYFIYGGVSEWRYKTGIDGEPAVSIQCSIYNAETMNVAWSATGSDSDWGNASIGTTAQELLLQMLEN